MDLLNQSSKEKINNYRNGVKPTSIDSTIPEPSPYLKEYMDFMAGLPGIAGGSTEIDGPTEETPYPVKKKVPFNTNNPTVQQSIQSIKQLPTSEYNKDYLYKLGLRESSLIPTATQGSYRGLYQFNDDSLKTVGILAQDYDTDLNAQHNAALNYKTINLKKLTPYLKYIGTSFKGIPITENGMAAAAHLLGTGTVKDWFDGTKHSDRAKKGFVDALGTSITEYFKMFSS